MSTLARRALFAGIAAAWLASLALPAIHLPSGAAYDGAELLRRAWAAPRAGVYAWYANPLFVAASVAAVLRWLRAAGVLSGVALVLALTSFAARPLARASGVAVPDWSFGAGFYLWLAALAALCAAAWGCVACERSTASAAGGKPAERD